MLAFTPRETWHRLPGEPVASALPDEIEHWRLVYGELLTFLDELLASSDSAATSLDRHAVRLRREELACSLQHWTRQASITSSP